MVTSQPFVHRTDKKLSSGKSAPLGATPLPGGVNFALYSLHAAAVYLVLFDQPDGPPTDIIQIEYRSGGVWHVFVPGVRPGQLYAFKVDGPYDPGRGLRFNRHKLLLDPYAKAVTGKFRPIDNLILPYRSKAAREDLVMDTRDSTKAAPRSVVVDDHFDWQGDRPPGISLDKLVIYEVHVKGFTRHRSARVRHPGTYLGLIEKIPYLQSLGVTAVELLPIQEFHERGELSGQGLREFWGYNTVGFFAPESSYSTMSSPGCAVSEFKQMVRALHHAGIEVILDVVCNHTGEGSRLGPSLCFRGIDNPVYYSLCRDETGPLREYIDLTGCGNTLNTEHPVVTRLIVDCLRYWVTQMHVDGFRFDLATVLGRSKGRFSPDAALLKAIADDPVLRAVKLIAEPWDIQTYQLGNFSPAWKEWNDRFRDTVRRFWRGDAGQIPELATRLTGSQDIFGRQGRSPYNSINFITCHDGFTLYDMFAYRRKHNRANKENNRDGQAENYSTNFGHEGPSSDPAIERLRRQMMKNALCCVLFSLGTPMLLAGDEVMRTQRGNNNAYCQDNPISWMKWNAGAPQQEMLAFFKKAIAFRKGYTALRRTQFFSGTDTDGNQIPDIAWFGTQLKAPHWGDIQARLIAYQIDAREAASGGKNYHLFIILNAGEQSQDVALPQHRGKQWFRIIDTSRSPGDDFLAAGREESLERPERYTTSARSVTVLISR